MVLRFVNELIDPLLPFRIIKIARPDRVQHAQTVAVRGIQLLRCLAPRQIPPTGNQLRSGCIVQHVMRPRPRPVRNDRVTDRPLVLCRHLRLRHRCTTNHKAKANGQKVRS